MLRDWTAGGIIPIIPVRNPDLSYERMNRGRRECVRARHRGDLTRAEFASAALTPLERRDARLSCAN